MSQLIILLGQRSGGSLSLRELNTLVPDDWQHHLDAMGGLQVWLAKFGTLFTVSGDIVTLTLSTASLQTAVDRDTTVETASIASTLSTSSTSEAHVMGNGTPQRDQEQPVDAAVVQLRGLPFQACISDVKRFLGPFADYLRDDSSIKIMYSRGGRPSGLARVQFEDVEVAREAQSELHMCVMTVSATKGTGAKDRYIEAFLASETPFNVKHDYTAQTKDPSAHRSDANGHGGMPIEGVYQECREYLGSCVGTQVVLSILGAALSDGSRTYLKKSGMRLKQLLMQNPSVFEIFGEKGQESVALTARCADHAQPEILELSELLRAGTPNAPTVNAPTSHRQNTTVVPVSQHTAVAPQPQRGLAPPLPQGQAAAVPARGGSAMAAATPSAPTQGAENRGCRQRSHNNPTLWLSGLPASTSEQDVLAFFSGHDVVECVSDDACAVNLVTEGGGGNQLSTLAIVEMRSARDAALAAEVLDGQWMVSGWKIRVTVRPGFASSVEQSGPHHHDVAAGKQEAQLESDPLCCPPSPRATRRVDSADNLRALLSPGCWPKARSPFVPWIVQWTPNCGNTNSIHKVHRACSALHDLKVHAVV